MDMPMHSSSEHLSQHFVELTISMKNNPSARSARTPVKNHISQGGRDLYCASRPDSSGQIFGSSIFLDSPPLEGGACPQQDSPCQVLWFCKETVFSGTFPSVYSYCSLFSEEQHSRGRIAANLVCWNCSSTAKKTKKNDNSRKPHTNLLNVGGLNHFSIK